MIESGILILNKGKDMTSHDCVNIVRRTLKIKRVGHTGTLDPMATGVLPICVGKATKIADFISFGDKTYVAELMLGIRTDTLDITGTVTEQKEPVTDEELIRQTISSFMGEVVQIPPMYSAKKVKGKKLYELARAGIEIEREPVKVNISQIQVLNIDTKTNRIKIEVTCSKGTYIRTLIDDIGVKLNCFATMTELVRTKSGMFSLSDKKTVDITEITKNNPSLIINNLIAIDKLFVDYPQIVLAYQLEQKFKNGIYLRLNDIGLNQKEVSLYELFRVYNTVGEFLALGVIETGPDDQLILKVSKSFY